MLDTFYMVCDSANLQPASSGTSGVPQQCSSPVWVEQQPGGLPPLDAASGIAIGVAILTCWATAYGFRSLRRVGE